MKKPGGQIWLAAPAPGHAKPGWHGVVPLVEPVGHQMPAPQLRHVVFALAPSVLEYVPARHCPVSRVPPPQNQPAGHCTVLDVEPAGQKMLALQKEHAATPTPPVPALNVPSGQFVHVGAAALEYLPVPHDVHTFVVALYADEDVPAAQGTGAEPPPGQ